MIIILGPDHTGKTTLAKKLSLSYYHFNKDNTYEDYLKPLTSLDCHNAVLDRHIICEHPYSMVMSRKFKFTMKQWHNIILLTLIQNPLFILCVSKPPEYKYSSEQYLPYDKWDLCLELYRQFLNTHHIPHLEYDYNLSISTKAILSYEAKYRESMSWWKPMWEAGYGCMGSPTPKVVLVAERIGPNNVNNLPFETGPTGIMLSGMLKETGTPLNKVTITNMVKSYRRDPRPPNSQDMDLLRLELGHLNPQKVVFMGTVSRQGIQVAKDLGIPYETMVHFGYYNYQRQSAAPLHEQWRKIMEIKS